MCIFLSIILCALYVGDVSLLLIYIHTYKVSDNEKYTDSLILIVAMQNKLQKKKLNSQNLEI